MLWPHTAIAWHGGTRRMYAPCARTTCCYNRWGTMAMIGVALQNRPNFGRGLAFHLQFLKVFGCQVWERGHNTFSDQFFGVAACANWCLYHEVAFANPELFEHFHVEPDERHAAQAVHVSGTGTHPALRLQDVHTVCTDTNLLAGLQLCARTQFPQ